MQTSRWLALVILMILVPGALAAEAQTADKFWEQNTERLRSRLKTGQRVYVLDPEQRETEGRLVSLTDSSLTIDVAGQPRVFTPDAIQRVARRGDTLYNGIAIGSGVVGGLYLISLTSTGCFDSESATLCLLVAGVGAGIGALVGAIVDFAIKGKTVVYESPVRRKPSIQPVLTRGGFGLRVSVVF